MTGATSRSSSTNLQLQPRDIELLIGLYESRVMTLQHAAALYFEGRPEAAKKRIQKLKAAELLGELPRRPADPSVLRLTNKGIRLLGDDGRLAKYPPLSARQMEKRTQVSPLTLQHELDVMSIKAAMMSSVRARPNLAIAEFSTWPVLNAFTVPAGRLSKGRPVKPDGFIRLHELGAAEAAFEYTFFLELDRSNESLDILAAKAEQYSLYYRSGGLAERHGRATSDFRDFPFRVLMVFRTVDRRDNVAARLLVNSPPILTLAWLTTFEEVIRDPLGPIWMCPARLPERWFWLGGRDRPAMAAFPTGPGRATNASRISRCRSRTAG